MGLNVNVIIAKIAVTTLALVKMDIVNFRQMAVTLKFMLDKMQYIRENAYVEIDNPNDPPYEEQVQALLDIVNQEIENGGN